ncbi:LPS-assembly protein LptD [Pseudooceanicola sp. LIPI14-2-Ac024]|uniref:LPS-assembly protein LptD n=1 Tax=Pseudooceanicola sp. LIPI14-2-Ac024 TaxID=3344875 RepID=UPI0035D01239
MTRLRILALLLALVLPAALQAQGVDGTAMLVADKVYLDGRDRVVAEGRVEALRGDVRLQADKVIYDRATGRLVITGPITLTQVGGSAVILADAAELDDDLRNGIAQGARMMLDQQVQLAAYQLDRRNGRFNQLYKATVSSCHICNDGRPPLWQIRAERVIHDEVERQLYFDNARFEVLGVPIFWLPRLRLPDPTVERASGFLIPSFSRDSRLGTGVRVPYFLTLGDSRDLTITPFITAETRTLELRYRQAFRNGKIEFEGAISRDTLLPDEWRGYIEGTGSFELPRDFRLAFGIEATSDDAYPTEYDYSDKDRLSSEISITRTRRDEFIRGALTNYHTLREDEDDANIPSLISDLSYERRFFPQRVGGEFRIGADLHSHYRYSDSDTDGADDDDIVDGRDVVRLTVDAAYLRSWTLPAGVLAEFEAGAAFDRFWTGQDASLPSGASGWAPRTGLTLRWPLKKIAAGGTVHILEPVAQIAWTGGDDLLVANDESTRVEFDEGNLLSLSRFPSPDRRERGWRGAVGMNWTMFTTSGWQTRLTAGQVLRDVTDDDFHISSGLSGRSSDLLLAAQVMGPNNFGITARSIIRDWSDLTKAEARVAWINPRVALGASYLWLDDDPEENRAKTISEWTVDGTVRLNENWLASADWRFDAATRSTAEAGIGFTYINECVEMDFSASRRFTSSTIVQPSTEFSFTVGLRGFSANADGQSFTRTCK